MVNTEPLLRSAMIQIRQRIHKFISNVQKMIVTYERTNKEEKKPKMRTSKLGQIVKDVHDCGWNR